MNLSVSESVCGPFKRDVWDSSSPPSPLVGISADSHGRCYRTPRLSTGGPGWQADVELKPLTTQGGPL